ncbi:MAG: hypothetical protein D6776_00540 [Planctomycetota bacterium]|nr:MAG: hypothetical protein D6776_00540 [Planctomycetota bacterium]
MLTVADIFKRIERIKKDLEYVRNFAEKWREQRERFPQIYEGILAQEREFERKIEELRRLPVQASAESLGVGEGSGEIRPRVSAPGSTGGRLDKGGDKASPSSGIEAKVRKRPAGAEREEAGAR